MEFLWFLVNFNEDHNDNVEADNNDDDDILYNANV